MARNKQSDEADERECSRPNRVKLTPPPRVDRVKPLYPLSPAIDGPSARGADRSSLTRGRSYGWITVTVFSVLMVVAFGVFFYLPRWVEQRGSTGKKEFPIEPTPSASEPQQVENLREQAQLKGQAEQIYQRVERSKVALEDMNVSGWGGEPYQAALAHIASGEEQFSERNFAAAVEAFHNAEELLEAVRLRARDILMKALEDGHRALSAGSSAAALQAFRLATSIDPENREAAAGIKRAEALDEVLALLASGMEHETKGDLQSASRDYRKAVSLDPLSRTAQQALARVDSRFAENAFVEIMSEGMAALERSDYATAREAFLQAKAMRPEAPETIDGLAQAEEGLRLQKIAEHRERALSLEATEQWRQAAEAYQAVLELDASIRFAREGRAKCIERADLSDRLEFHIKNPNRLSDDGVLEAATAVLATASAFTPAGPQLQKQIALLERIIAEAGTSITVRFQSDELTEVVIYKVGRLGKFKERSLELRPGSYTVVGSRRGYRDVRLQLVVVAGRVPEALVVRCEEKI